MKAKNAKQIQEQEYERLLLPEEDSNAEGWVKEDEKTIQSESGKAHSLEALPKNGETKKRFFHLTKPKWTIIRKRNVEYM
jgi:hypothetical protein